MGRRHVWGRFTRRAGLRAGLAAVLAAPLGRDAALVAATAGAAQEHTAIGAALGTVTAGVVARRLRRTPPASPPPAAGHRSRAGHSAVRRRPWRRLGWAARGAVAGRARLAALVIAGIGVALATRVVWSVAPKHAAAVAPQRTGAVSEPSPRGRGIGVVVNSGAGSVRRGRRDVAAALHHALPEADVVVLDDPLRLAGELERMAASGRRALGVAGGDGSINTAAEVALRHRLPLLVVPAGTLNHLARDLGVETVDDALAAVRSGTGVEIDVAHIAGRPFLNTASFGSYVEIVDARETLEDRIGKWPALMVAVARVLRRGGPVEVEIDGERRRVWAAFVGNCRYQPDGMAPTWRERFDDGQLDVRLADASHPFSRTRLVLATMTGRLHRSRVFQSWRTTRLHVRSPDGPLRLARDGETFDGPRSFDIAKDGGRLAVYAPGEGP